MAEVRSLEYLQYAVNHGEASQVFLFLRLLWRCWGVLIGQTSSSYIKHNNKTLQSSIPLVLLQGRSCGAQKNNRISRCGCVHGLHQGRREKHVCNFHSASNHHISHQQAHSGSWGSVCLSVCHLFSQPMKRWEFRVLAHMYRSLVRAHCVWERTRHINHTWAEPPGTTCMLQQCINNKHTSVRTGVIFTEIVCLRLHAWLPCYPSRSCWKHLQRVSWLKNRQAKADKKRRRERKWSQNWSVYGLVVPVSLIIWWQNFRKRKRKHYAYTHS